MGKCVKLDKYLSFRPINLPIDKFLQCLNALQCVGALVDMREGKDKV